MGKMNGAWHSISMLVIIIFILAASGVINMTSPYKAGDPSLPNTVTVCDRSISLLSGDDNLYNALGYAYSDITYSFWGMDKQSKLTLKRYSDHIYIYYLDMFGKYPDKCSIYNGITTASTKKELEAAFGTDCIKTDSYYAEIFIDGKEADYESIDYPEDFDSDDFSFEEWFEAIKNDYPEAEFITVLFCDYYSDGSHNNITFFVYDPNAIE